MNSFARSVPMNTVALRIGTALLIIALMALGWFASPIVFPEVVDGGGYTTEFILLRAGSSAMSLNFFGEDGCALNIGK